MAEKMFSAPISTSSCSASKPEGFWEHTGILNSNIQTRNSWLSLYAHVYTLRETNIAPKKGWLED